MIKSDHYMEFNPFNQSFRRGGFDSIAINTFTLKKERSKTDGKCLILTEMIGHIGFDFSNRWFSILFLVTSFFENDWWICMFQAFDFTFHLDCSLFASTHCFSNQELDCNKLIAPKLRSMQEIVDCSFHSPLAAVCEAGALQISLF